MVEGIRPVPKKLVEKPRAWQYIAIVGSTDASAVPHMVAYMLRVIRAARMKGSRWIEFAKEYRMKAAAQGNRKWSVHDADL